MIRNDCRRRPVAIHIPVGVAAEIEMVPVSFLADEASHGINDVNDPSAPTKLSFVLAEINSWLASDLEKAVCLPRGTDCGTRCYPVEILLQYWPALKLDTAAVRPSQDGEQVGIGNRKSFTQQEVARLEMFGEEVQLLGVPLANGSFCFV